MKNNKHIMLFEDFNSFKDKILSRPRIIKSGTKVKYKDENDEIRTGTYIRDTIFRGEYSAASLFAKVISIIKDDELGRIKIEKDKLEEVK